MTESNPNPAPEEPNASEDDDLAPTPIDEQDQEETGEQAAPEASQAAEAFAASPVADLEAQLATAKDQTMRALAEVENTRRRAQKDREEASKYGVTNFARDLLSVADNLRRALDSLPENTDVLDPAVKNVIEGVEATERELLRAFEKHQIKILDPQGDIFNPTYHEVMFETPGTGQPGGTVIQVIEKGYTLHDRLLRPARVGVAKDEGGENGAPSTDPGSNIDLDA